MKRRELLALIGGAAALAPFGATAQPGTWWPTEPPGSTSAAAVGSGRPARTAAAVSPLHPPPGYVFG